uniref:Uncharacterized protein n=1 Tax=Oryza glumipatula TaxID=40148 RepID=A0A0D9ZF03_9ORYZ
MSASSRLPGRAASRDQTKPGPFYIGPVEGSSRNPVFCIRLGSSATPRTVAAHRRSSAAARRRRRDRVLVGAV